MIRLINLPVLGSIVILGSCSPPAEMTSPISEPGLVSYNQQLLGKWHGNLFGEEEGEEELITGVEALTIWPHPNGFLVIDYSRMAAGQEAEEGGAGLIWTRRTAYASLIDGETYYNSRAVDFFEVLKLVGKRPMLEQDEIDDDVFPRLFAPHEKRGFWIMSPEFVDSETLRLRYLSVADLENQGFIGKEIDCGSNCSFTTFDLSPEDLVAIIRRTDPKDLFTGDLGTFVRNEVGTLPTPR